jgi:hypothetical protein
MFVIGDLKREKRPNSSQQPTRGRSLARGFRRSFQRDAARRAAGT